MKTTITEWHVIGVFIFLIVFIAIVHPAFEARTFNKFRPDGAPKATYWDAM